MSRVHIPAPLRKLVIEQANGRCEYCLVHQDDSPFTHHLDHLIALKHGGQTIESNLALACLDCNRTKALTLQPLTRRMALLFPSSIPAPKPGASILRWKAPESPGRRPLAGLLQICSG